MHIKNNPFTSNTFETIWLRHYLANKPSVALKGFNGLHFFKFPCIALYINIGKNLTKGISYGRNFKKEMDIGNRVVLIYDVPTYVDLDLYNSDKKLKMVKIRQYPGFLVNLEKYHDLTDYMSKTFGKNSRYKLKKYKNRFESCFNITYKMFYGDIAKEEYKDIFDHFKRLLEKRFEDKKITNNNLNPKEWNFYRDVAYPMILKKEASLFVIYDNGKPIGVTLNYFSESILFDAITVFDIDYSKFHLGSITIMKLIEWSLQQNFKIFDFSKGYFDYKTRWADKQYDFEYHIYYDSTSITATGIASVVSRYFRIKQWLREKNINEKAHKFSFYFKNKASDQVQNMDYELSELSPPLRREKLVTIDCEKEENHFIKMMVFDFLYLKNEAYQDLSVHKEIGKDSSYILEGKVHMAKLVRK